MIDYLIKDKALLLISSLCLTVFASHSIFAAQANTTQYLDKDVLSAKSLNENFDSLKNTINTNDANKDTDALNAIKASGVREITNNLISATSIYKIGGILIPDGGQVSKSITIPDLGVVTNITISVKLRLKQSTTSNITIDLTAPDNTSYTLFRGSTNGGAASSLAGKWPPDPLDTGDISTWIGNNPVGVWTLTVIDDLPNSLATDGEISEWKIKFEGFSNNTATINGDLTVKGTIRALGRGPNITMVKMSFSRGTGNIISFADATGILYSLDIADPAVAQGNTHIYFTPTSAGGDPMLLFNISSSPSLACTLLHREDDRPIDSKDLYWATDGGNTGINAKAWGNSITRTFMIAKSAGIGIPLVSNRAYSIICF